MRRAARGEGAREAKAIALRVAGKAESGEAAGRRGEKSRDAAPAPLSALARGWKRAALGLGAAVRRHPYLSVALAAGVALRLIVSLAFQPALMFHADSYAYMKVAEKLLPGQYRPSLYGLFLRLAFPFHSLWPITVLQHLMGLGVAIGIYVLLRRLGVGVAGAVIAAVPILLDAYQLNVEHYILTEALFQLLVFAAFFLIVWPTKPSTKAALGAGLLLGAASVTRLSALVLIVPCVVYMLWKKHGYVRALGLVGSFVVPLVLYATWFYAQWGSFAITSQDGLFLYGRVAPFAECSTAEIPRYQRVLCDKRPPSQRPGPEYYVWRRRHADSPLRRLILPPRKDRQEVLKEFSGSIIRAQPGDYLATVGRDLAHYFGPERRQRPRDALLRSYLFTDSFDFGPVDERAVEAQRAYARDLPEVIRLFRGSPRPGTLLGDFPPQLRIVAPLARFLRSYQQVFYTYGPLLALALLAGLAGMILRWPNGKRSSLRPECFLFTTAGLALLLVPAATAVFDYRYILPTLPLLPPAGAMGAQVVAARLRAAVRRRHPGVHERRAEPRENPTRP